MQLLAVSGFLIRGWGEQKERRERIEERGGDKESSQRPSPSIPFNCHPVPYRSFLSRSDPLTKNAKVYRPKFCFFQT